MSIVVTGGVPSFSPRRSRPAFLRFGVRPDYWCAVASLCVAPAEVMTLVLCPASHRGRIHSALSGRAEFASDWQDLVARAKRAQCVILDIERLTREWIERVRSLRDSVPRLPLVLVLPLSTENAEPLAQLGVAFVWQDDAPNRLREIVANARARQTDVLLLARVRALPHIRGKLGGYVELVITASPPVHTTKRLAVLAGKTESAIQEVWSRAIRRKGGGRPKAFLSAVLAYRAAALARSGTPPEILLDELGISKRTLERLVQRAFDVTPAGLAGVTHRRALAGVISALSIRDPANPDEEKPTRQIDAKHRRFVAGAAAGKA